MVPGGITGYSHQPDPHYPQVSSSVSLHCTHPSISLSLPFLYHLLAPLSGTQGVSGSGLVSAMLFPAHAVWPWAEVISTQRHIFFLLTLRA